MPILLRQERDPSLAKSALAVAFWCLLALAFNGFVAWRMGREAGLQFSTGYLLEWSLSMDNVFIFALIFRYFHVSKLDQHRILYWGLLGAVVLRLAFILTGVALISRFQILLPLLGLFLLFAAYRLVRYPPEHMDPERNVVLRLGRRWLPMADVESSTTGGPFLIRQRGRWKITPLMLVLLVVESTDLVFAVDSIPTIFGITRDPFIVFSSNIFAILGLRSLYFLLAGVMDRFRYLHYGLGAVLGFVGLKMVAEGWLPHKGAEIVPNWVSLAVIVTLLAAAIGASLRKRN